ncbi:MFS transporter [Pseudonocardia benzenivorans]|uniref:MFS transporter n=1 Tax=Pseudonocardia benzenivorans TaxID=228005 RepID=A0ABW3VD50_9PSEU
MKAEEGQARAFTVLAVAAASFSMLQSLVSPVLSTIQHDLGTTPNAVAWVLIAWLLSAAVATPILGRIGDMIGKNRTLVVALSAIVVGSVVAALAPNLDVLVVGRVLQGLGGAVFPLTFGILRDEFPAQRLASVVGAMSAVIAVGAGLGTLLAGPVVALGGWRALFWLPAVVVALTATAAHLLVPASPVRAGGRINWLGAALLAAWLVALLVPLSMGDQWGWASPAVIAPLVGSVVLLAAWVVAESRSGHPVIDMRVMRLRGVWTTNLVALLFGASMFAVYAYVPVFVQTPAAAGYGFSATIGEAGRLLLPALVTMALGGVLSGPLAPYVGLRAQLASGSALIAASCAGFAFVHTSAWEIAVESGVFGLGLGIAYAAMSSVIVQTVPPSQTGAATGMSTNIRTIGGAIGTAVTATVLAAHPGPSGLPAESGYTTAFVVMGGAALVGMATSFAVPAARRAAAREPVAATPVEPGAGPVPDLAPGAPASAAVRAGAAG